MRIRGVATVALMALSLCACTQEDKRQASQESDTAARKAGRAAHKLADETETAAKKAGRKLDEWGKEARQGWNEAGKDHPKQKK